MSADLTDPCRPHRLTARQNALANLRLLNACARLEPGDWTAPRVGFFGSLQATLNHLYTVDLFYIDALHGGRAGFLHRDNPLPLPDLARLRAAQMQLDLRLVGFCDALKPAGLTRIVAVQRSAGVQHEPLPDLLLHLALHAVHHRGQAHTMLSATSVAPPQLDEFICRNDCVDRTAEMADLGWTEEYLGS
ncbi:DinB family protein [Pseudooceanicola sp.]|uniref:DinB family protein n=1 Tax=Pseudooceanicola sp. TaxID=1914328 RepID=UPI0026291F9E|nr:DinB family protein [Pseudooceanicola sp.]MDF1853950.1 DinB family protein [Pseudooceanicola sp.]